MEDLEVMDLDASPAAPASVDHVSRAFGATACLLLLVLIGLVASIRSQLSAHDEQPRTLRGLTASNGRQLVGPNADDDREEARIVRALVLGEHRASDMTTFGEFVGRRFMASCPDASPSDVVFGLRWQSPGPHYSITVGAPGYRAGATFEIAELRWQDGAVLEVEASDYAGTPTHWLNEFRGGQP